MFGTDLVGAVERRMLPSLALLESNKDGLRGWLEKGQYNFGKNTVLNKISIENVYWEDMVPFIGYDFSRFSLSSLETIAICARSLDDAKEMAWPLLKLYYAAFFAAHAILRLTGNGVIRLDQSIANRLSQFASNFGLQVQFSSGNYAYKVSQVSTSLVQLDLTVATGGAGAHEQFWTEFDKFLKSLALDVVAQSDPDSNAIIAEIDALQAALSGNGAFRGTWLSDFRNKLNYRHEYSVWFPYGASRKSFSDYKRIDLGHSISLNLNGDHIREPIKTFISTCFTLSKIHHMLSTRLRSRLNAKSIYFRRVVQLERLLA